MLRLALCRLSLLLCVWLFAVPGWSATITPQQRAEDKRLEHPITLNVPHIYLGEFIERLAGETGVDISMDNRDEGSGAVICAYLSRIPLGDVMDALWSLNSFRGAEWHWQRSGEAGKYRYRFMRTDSAKNLAGKLRQSIQSSFEQEAALLQVSAKLSPEERKKWMDKEKSEDPLLSDERVLGGIRIFGEAFPPAMQAQILRGEENPTIQVNQLSPQSQDFLRQEMKLARQEGRLPSTLRFHTLLSWDELFPRFTWNWTNLAATATWAVRLCKIKCTETWRRTG